MSLIKIPAYLRHWIFWDMGIVAPIPKRKETEKEKEKYMIIFHVLSVTWQVSHVRCHVSGVMCHLSHVTLFDQKSPVDWETGFLRWHTQTDRRLTEISNYRQGHPLFKWKYCGKKSTGNLLKGTIICQWVTCFLKLLAIYFRPFLSSSTQ